MNISTLWIIISIIAIMVISILLVVSIKNKKKAKISTLTIVSIGFIIAGICFSGEQIIGYSLLGIGVLLALIDIYRGLKKK